MRIPQKYSNELQTIILHMLRVNPRERFECGQLLELIDQFKPNLETAQDLENYTLIHGEDEEHDMLATINLPKDLKLLDRRLPRSNYAKKNSHKLKDMLDEIPEPNAKARIVSGTTCNLICDIDQDSIPQKNQMLGAYPIEVPSDPYSQYQTSVNSNGSQLPNYHDNQRNYHDSLAKQLHGRVNPNPSDHLSRIKRAYPESDNIFQPSKAAERLLQNRSIVDSTGQKLSLQQRIQLINSQNPVIRTPRIPDGSEEISRPHSELLSPQVKRQVIGHIRTPVNNRQASEEYSGIISEQHLPGIYPRSGKGSRQVLSV